MLLSIIIPMYNCADTICSLLDSIILQNFKDYELILVDDGSSDCTLEKVIEYKTKMHNMIVLEQENMGAPSARNLGLHSASGKYIYFCDSDDLLSCDFFDLIKDDLYREEYDLVVGKVKHFTDEVIYGKEYQILIPGSNMLKEKKYFMCDPIPGTKIYKKEIIDKYNIRFANVKIGQDLNFYIKFLLSTKKVKECKNVIYYYRHREGSISRTYSIEKIIDIRESINDIIQFSKNTTHNYEENKSVLEMLKLSNYNWQLKKKKNLESYDYEDLKKELYSDIHLEIVDKRNFFPFFIATIDYILIKYFDVIR